jgi:hypothetical protein
MKWCAIACYRPKRGQKGKLLAILAKHAATLRAENLISERGSILARAKDGTIVEIFEWRSAAAKEQAHRNPAVRQLWEPMMECCEFPGLGDLDEARHPFASFEVLEPRV